MSSGADRINASQTAVDFFLRLFCCGKILRINESLKKNKILKFLFKKDELHININHKIKEKSC